MKKQIAVLVGSLSKQSLNRKIAQFLADNAPENLQLNFIEIGDLPLYDRDLDENSPAQYDRIRNEIKNSDGTIWVTPEHNGSIPAVLKNAIDICSRPQGQNLWVGKPLGVVTAAAAMAGGQRVGDQLRTMGIHMGMPVYHNQTPISQVYAVFGEDGKLNNEFVIERLQGFISGYGKFVAALSE